MGDGGEPQEEDPHHGDEDSSRDHRGLEMGSNVKRRNSTNINKTLAPIDEVIRSGCLRWFGHIERRDKNNVTRRVIYLK